MFRSSVHFTVNGEFIELKGKDAFAPLSDILRYKLRKPGTKVVCAEGDCGACTVMLARANTSKPNYRSINSCILTAFLADGCHIVTVEGLNKNNDLHEVQKSMIKNFGGQCGFCTPGFVMSITNMLEQKKNPDIQNIKNYLTGNLCRCTGYQPIIDATKYINSKKIKPLSEMYSLKFETIELQEKIKLPILIETEDKEFFAPKNIDQAIDFKKKNPKARIFSGATDIGVQINKGKEVGNKQLSLHLIDELYQIKIENDEVNIGARVTLDAVQNFMQDHSPVFANFLNIFASPQIKNSATLVGNLANGSPIADTTPFLLTADTEVEVTGPNKTHHVPLTQFFKAYKTFNIEDYEFIKSLRLNLAKIKSFKSALYKVSQRRDLDISCVNASFAFDVSKEKIQSARIAYGGVGPVPLRLHSLEQKLAGQKINSEFVGNTKKMIAESFEPLSDVRGTGEFRKLIATQLFEKFCKEHLNL